MLKKNESTINRIQKIIEFSIIFLIWFSLYFIRFTFFDKAQLGLENDFIIYGLILSLLTVIIFKFNGLYNSQRLIKQIEEAQEVVWSQSITFFIFVVILYFFVNSKISRSVIILYFLIGTPCLILWRLLLRKFMGSLRKKGYNLRHFLVIGFNNSILDFLEKIEQNKSSGILITKWLTEVPDLQQTKLKKWKNVISNYDKNQFTNILAHTPPDAILIAIDSKNPKYTQNILIQTQNLIVPIYVIPDISLSFVGSSIETIAGIPTYKLNQPAFSEIDLFLKRTLDIIGAIFGLILSSPILIATALGVKLTSPGPIFFSQERIGLDGEKFKMYKFRSMRIDAEKHSQWTTADDPRKTKFGSFIRSKSIDELPQFFNVLLGDMSLVGPRPEQPRFVEKFKNEIPAYMLRHKMKAGITGWAQINGWRGDTSLEKRIEFDLFYIRNWSIWFDLKILFLTPIKGLINKNAY